MHCGDSQLVDILTPSSGSTLHAPVAVPCMPWYQYPACLQPKQGVVGMDLPFWHCLTCAGYAAQRVHLLRTCALTPDKHAYIHTHVLPHRTRRWPC